MFFVIILVTSCSSLLSLSKLDPRDALAARVSRYNRAVLDMKVSNPTKAYGFLTDSTLGP